MATTKKGMTEKSRKVLDFLKGNGVGAKFTHKEVADALGFEATTAVVGSVQHLVNKGYAVREKEERTDAEGKSKLVSVFYLTQEGMDFNPDEITTAE